MTRDEWIKLVAIDEINEDDVTVSLEWELFHVRMKTVQVSREPDQEHSFERDKELTALMQRRAELMVALSALYRFHALP